jgi:hypothetical protein
MKVYFLFRGQPGLPDGLFSNQKYQFGLIFKVLRMKNVCIFYDHLECFTAIWYNLWPFGIVCGHLVYSPHFGMFGKIWQPCEQLQKSRKR